MADDSAAQALPAEGEARNKSLKDGRERERWRFVHFHSYQEEAHGKQDVLRFFCSFRAHIHDIGSKRRLKQLV